MYVIFEEIENETAVLIPDSKMSAIHISLSDMPEEAAIGDVFVADNTTGKWVLTKDEAEKNRRIAVSRKKREKLLKRSRNKKRK